MDDQHSKFRPKGPTEQRIEAEHDRPAVDVIRDLYDQGLTQQQIAERLGASRWWVVEYMKARGIQARDRRAVRAIA